MSFDGWLDARDGEAVARAWQALPAKLDRVGRGGRGTPSWWTITPHGAVQVAAAFLGWPIDKLAWLTAQPAQMPPPVFDVRRTTQRCFLEHAGLDYRGCWEEWQIRELVDGARGVQHVDIGFWPDVGVRDDVGPDGSAQVIRVFDRDAGRAVSIRIVSCDVWTIGEIDLAPLDLFAHRAKFKLAWQRCDLDTVRGFLAQILAELDAHFDVSATWGAGVIADRVIDEREKEYRARRRVHRFASGDHAIEIDEPLDRGKPEYGWLIATADGLPWGHDVRVQFSLADPVEGWVDLRLPLARGDALLARLASIPGIEVHP